MTDGTSRIGNCTDLIAQAPREISVVENNGSCLAEAGSYTSIRFCIRFVSLIWRDCPAVQPDASLAVDRVQRDVSPAEPLRWARAKPRLYGFEFHPRGT